MAQGNRWWVTLPILRNAAVSAAVGTSAKGLASDSSVPWHFQVLRLRQARSGKVARYRATGHQPEDHLVQPILILGHGFVFIKSRGVVRSALSGHYASSEYQETKAE
jgi:hypothetical protein